MTLWVGVRMFADEEPDSRCYECGHKVALHWDSDDDESFRCPCRGTRWTENGDDVDCGCEELD